MKKDAESSRSQAATRMARFVIRIAVCVMMTCVPLSSAFAFEIFGFRFFGGEENEQNSDLIDPKKYQLAFSIDGEQQVADRVKSASQLWLFRERAVAGTAGIISRAKGDYRRIQAALYNEGYYGGSISIRISDEEAADIKPANQIQDNPDIVVSIQTGPIYTFGKLTVENDPVRPSGEAEQPSDFQTGAIAFADAVRKKRRMLISDWRSLGHPKAEISSQKVSANHKTREVNVTLRVNSGPKATIGSVSLDGVSRINPDFALRQTGLKPGKLFRPKDIEKADKRLSRLEVFSTQKFEEGEISASDDTLPINVLVKERPPRRVGAGATVSNVDGAGLQAFILHRNLFGQAERARLTGEISRIGQTTDLGELDYRVDAEFTRPGVFHPDVNFNSRLTAVRDFNDTFEETSVENETGFSYLKSDALTLGAGGRLQFGEFEDAFGTRDLFTVGLFGDVILDKRDSRLEPTKGFYLGATINPFYEFEFDNAGARFTLEGRSYKSFGNDDRFTFAARGRAGSLVGPEREETAPDFLFFTGGGGSVRGFGFKTIGVTEDNGDITGGQSFLEGSFETRFRATDTFGGVLFIDAGAVSETSTFDFNDGASIGIGAGIRYFTSLGPIRLDIAVPLNRGPDDPPVAIFAGIGQSF